MLTKAYISEVINSNNIRVRIPLYNKVEGVNGATPKDELASACVCSLPNFITAPQVGDVVIIGFEEDDVSKPVILGYLSKNTELDSKTDVICNKLTALDDVNLSTYTTIGDIKPENIKCLKDLRDNIKDTFEITSQAISTINTEIASLSTNIGTNIADTAANTEAIARLSNSIVNLSSRVSTLEGNHNALLAKFDDYLMKYPTILGSGTYGTNLPSTGEGGQVYFTIKGEN